MKDDNNYMQKLVLIILVLLVAVSPKVFISNLGHDFTPKDELDYVNYLKLILGRHDESTTLSKGLTELTAKQKLSLQTAVSRVVLALMPLLDKQDKNHEGQTQAEIEMKGKLLQQLVFETPQLFIITHLPASEEATLHNLVEVYGKQGKVVHVIRGDENQIKKLVKLLDMEDPQYSGRINHPTRRLTEQKGASIIY